MTKAQQENKHFVWFELPKKINSKLAKNLYNNLFPLTQVP